MNLSYWTVFGLSTSKILKCLIAFEFLHILDTELQTTRYNRSGTWILKHLKPKIKP